MPGRSWEHQGRVPDFHLSDDVKRQIDGRLPAVLERLWPWFWDHVGQELGDSGRAAELLEEVALAKMQKLTGREWKGDMYVFATEGTGKSALTAGANICVGPLDHDGDAGFVHEGLHLLLREEWAQAPHIQAFMAGRTFSDPFWKRWPAKYEQALVASLDILIRGLNVKYGPRGEDKVVRNYLEGVRAGDLVDIVWPLVKKHAADPGSLEDLMLAILTQAER